MRNYAEIKNGAKKRKIRETRRLLAKAQREFERTGELEAFKKANALDDELFCAYYL